MTSTATVVLGLALTAAPLAWAQAPEGKPAAAASSAKSAPSDAAQRSGFTIDQKGKRAASAGAPDAKAGGDSTRTPAHTPEWTPGPAKTRAATTAPAPQATPRKAGKLSGNGKDTEPADTRTKAQHDAAKSSPNNVR